MKVGSANKIKKRGPRKKTKQGRGKFTKKFHNKKSKNYKKPYRGQGRQPSLTSFQTSGRMYILLEVFFYGSNNDR